ncbi:MAG: glycosyltransferase family 9 protein [Candidatus Omnitrophica bacterium]|nr:glycosyltransferase family 9 protein [Candidatus Omnitrophota bacterium]
MMQRILIVNPYGIGDVLCTLPLLEALHRAHPDAVLGFLCNRRTESLVKLFPNLKECIVYEKDELRAAGWRETLKLFGRLKKRRWDTVLDLSLSSQFSAAGAALGIGRRIGFDFRRRGKFLTHRIPLSGFRNRHVSEYYLDLLSALEIPRPASSEIRISISPQMLKPAQEHLRAAGVDPSSQNIIALVPGGGASWGPNAPMKQWPVAHFAQLARRIQNERPCRIVLLGDQRDHALCREIQAAAGGSVCLKPAGDLGVLAGILSVCKLVIGNDSGVLHMAVAVGTRSVSIFGPANPLVYGPRIEALQKHRVAIQPLACRPCYDQFRLPPCPWGVQCLRKLETDRVYRIAQELLAA